MPSGQKAISNRWVFDTKSDGHKKARLVAKGFSQIEGVDYDEIFSPVVRYETFCITCALAALEGWHMDALDIRSAFLYGDLDEEIYMKQPEGFAVKGKEHKILCLKRALYGLKQAANAWFCKLNKSMDKLGFIRTQSDAGIFIHRSKDNQLIIACIYVDDVIFCGSNKDLVRLKK